MGEPVVPTAASIRVRLPRRLQPSSNIQRSAGSISHKRVPDSAALVGPSQEQLPSKTPISPDNRTWDEAPKARIG